MVVPITAVAAPAPALLNVIVAVRRGASRSHNRLHLPSSVISEGFQGRRALDYRSQLVAIVARS